MDSYVIQSIAEAAMMVADPFRIGLVFLGVLVGMSIGIIPGLGGSIGLVLLFPFTYAMDPYSAFALLLGMQSVTTTSDTLPAVLFGVPGTAGSAATVLDGVPMSQKGESGRALSAAYFSSMLGGVFGALCLAITIPIIRPFILLFQTPEMLALAVLGISMVASLSGKSALRGLIAAGIGIIISMVGIDSQTATMRWTMDSLYLWDGVGMLPLILGFFALPELCDMAIKRTAISGELKFSIREGLVQGMKDVLHNKWLVIRCASIGSFFGAIPGIGGTVIDWLAYGHARRSVKDAEKTFGTGDVRGIIAPESSNNAKEGGALIPTLAFGIPGTAGMAILLGAFLIQGIQPGPAMVSKHLSLTYSMVMTIAVANILCTGICLLFSGYLARLAILRYTLVLPLILSVIFVGAFMASRSLGDIYTLLIFGFLGWLMKAMQWPRPPLVLGYILGAVIERYVFISAERYGLDWLSRPGVIIIFAIALWCLLRPLWSDIRSIGYFGKFSQMISAPRFRPSQIFQLFLIVLFSVMTIEAVSWNEKARLGPMIILVALLAFLLISLLLDIFAVNFLEKRHGGNQIHMDLVADTADLGSGVIAKRAALFFGWLIAILILMQAIGFILTVPIFVLCFMRFQGHERWKLVIPQVVGISLFVYLVFDRMLGIPWPPTLVGHLIPALHWFPGV